MSNNNWKKINRKEILNSMFLTVFEDTVMLPNGKIIDDYTLIKKPSIVMIVATTPDNKLLVFREYKYAADKVLNTLPAGHLEEDETDVDAARRELSEETGYTSEDITSVSILYEYPTKDLHRVHVVCAKNIEMNSEQSLEVTENIKDFRFLTQEEVKKEIKEGKWVISSVLSALLVSGFLLLDKK